MQAYTDFLKSKIILAKQSGFDLDPGEIHPALKPHCRDAVVWALAGGCRALFEDFGLHKTIQQLELGHQVYTHQEGKRPFLQLVPLGVRQEFCRDATLHLERGAPPYITTMAEAEAAAAAGTEIVLTNVERVRDGEIDPRWFCGASIDEAACLRDIGSKNYQVFIRKFSGLRYLFVATATPSPNSYDELLNYAALLGIMDRGQALTRFFKRNSQKAGDLTLYEGKEREFWLWVSSWALFITKPSDLGYSDEGYDLPPLEIRYHEVEMDSGPVVDRDGQLMLERNVAGSVQDAAAERRESVTARMAKAKEIVDGEPENHFILWHDREDERKAILQALPEAVDIFGAMPYEERERRVIDFAEGRSRLFATKKRLSGSGCNFQRHCHRAIFTGVDYFFEAFIQAIHRIYRFLQAEHVRIDIIHTSAERGIVADLLRKWRQHDQQREQMASIIKEYGLSGTSMLEKMARSIGVERVVVEGKHFKAVHNDCVLETAEMAENSIDLVCTSIPFGNHYEYSASYNDFGHNATTGRFFEQMDYLTPDLLRVLRPGRVATIHVKDRVLFGKATGTGMPTIEPFHVYTIEHFIRHGFEYFGMITVVTDVVRENNQTYRLGWSEQCKDGTKMGVGCPEYILLFRKLPSDTSTAYADVPVAKSKDDYTRAQWQIDAHGYWRSGGDRLLTKAEIAAAPMEQLQKLYTKYSGQTVYDYAEHVALAKELDECGKLPATFMVVAPASWTDEVWDDINRLRTLNSEQSRRRLENHICPLPLDIVERIITRFSNTGDTVYDPFGGLMSVPYMAIKMARRGVGCELNVDYYRDGVGYCESAEAEVAQPTLFDLVEGA